MPNKHNAPGDAVAEFQRQAQELLRAQQEAYLAAVKAWRENLAKGVPPAWPTPPTPQEPKATLQPNANELAEASYAFVAKLVADQTRFMQELGKTLAGSNDGTTDRNGKP
jgi:hypothetical protein